MAEEQEAEPLSPTQIHQKVILVLSNFHKTTLNAGRGHEASRKAAHSLQKEVGQNIRDKRETKVLGMKTHSREGVLQEVKFPNARKPSHQRVCGGVL